MSHLDKSIEIYREVIGIIDKKEAKGKGLKSVRKKLNKRIDQIEQQLELVSEVLENIVEQTRNIREALINLSKE